MRSWLTFSNVASLAALVFAVGGISYAAIEIPKDSVGTPQLKDRSVTKAKLANKSVPDRALTPQLRQAITSAGSPGAPGATGPGAGRLRFFQQASGSPTPEPVLEYAGLRFTGTCTLTGTTTILNLTATSDQAGVFSANFNTDVGTDPHVPGTLTSGNIQIDVPGGTESPLGGPGADPPDFARVIANAVLVTPARTIQLEIVEFVDAVAQTCAVNGVAVSAS